LANIVDDHLMKISHVIRGEEWLPSLALHVLLYRAFEWPAPEFAHLPLLLKPEGKGKLSKRDGDKFGFPVFPLEWKSDGNISRGYREDGYFPEAVVNMLALLGWNEGEGSEKELYSLKELIKVFSLEHVSKSGAKFNPDKARWFNHQYLQQRENSKIIDDILNNFVELNNISEQELIKKLKKVIPLVKERVDFSKEIVLNNMFLFEAPKSFDERAVKKQWKESSSSLMKDLIVNLNTVDPFSIQNLEKQIKTWITINEISFGKVMQPLRLSLVGAMKGPQLFDIMELIGKQETIRRIEKAIVMLS
jgi:glutamyl-tRNA synthetase